MVVALQLLVIVSCGARLAGELEYVLTTVLVLVTRVPYCVVFVSCGVRVPVGLVCVVKVVKELVKTLVATAVFVKWFSFVEALGALSRAALFVTMLVEVKVLVKNSLVTQAGPLVTTVSTRVATKWIFPKGNE